MNRGDWRGAEIDNAQRWATPETSVWSERVINRRRPWHQRLIRKVTRHVPLDVVVKPSPFAVALVLATASAGSVACLFKQQSNLPS